MKKTYIIFTLILVSHSIFATNIIKSPGSTTDVFNELSIQNIFNADTLIIEGGFNDIYLHAGSSDNGSPYCWDIGTRSETTYQITFSYTDATRSLSDGRKGALIAISRSNPVQNQYIWIIYNDLPLKPSTPTGANSACLGTNSNYSTSSTNADSYEWLINPTEAGTLVNETTNTVTVNWSNSWKGEAYLKAKGVKGGDKSPFSDSLTIHVMDVPDKPNISGSSILEKGETATFYGTSNNAIDWEWLVDPKPTNTTLADNQINIEFADTANYILIARTNNTCGNSSYSDNFAIKVFDLLGLQNQILQLQTDTLIYKDLIVDLQSENVILLDSVDKINAANDDLQIQVEEFSSENTILLSQVNNLTLQTDSLLVVNDNLESIIADYKEQVSFLTKDNVELQEQVDTLLIAYNDLSQQVEELTIDYNNLNAEVLPIINENIALKEQVDSIKNVNDALQIEVSDLTASVVSMEILLKDLLAANSELIDSIGKLEEQIIILSQVYVLSWEVEEVITKVFETEVGNFSISLYPNPSPGVIYIDCTEEIKEVKIYNLQGHLVKQFAVNNIETSLTVYQDDMPKGIYLIHIKTNKGNSIHKIIFQ